MELFIFSWSIKSENPIIIIGHGLDINNNYSYITISNYLSFCYYESSNPGYITMETSEDIYTTKNFKKVYSRYRNDLRGHMSELPLLSLFTADTKLEFTGWVDTDLYKPIEKDIHPCPLILSFDIETTTLEVTEGKIEIISCVFSRYTEEKKSKYLIHLDDVSIELDNVTCISCRNELDIIDSFFKLVATINPDVIIGFNIYGFDFDYIVSKLQYYVHYTTQCTRPTLDHFTILEMDWESSAYGYNKYSKISIEGRIIFDVMLYFKRFKLERYTLQNISQNFLNESKEDMTYEEMFECFRTRKNIDKVASYCIQDSVLVLKLFNKFHIWNELCEMSKIMRCNIEDIYTRGEQLKVTNQMIKECIDRNIVLVKRLTDKKKDYTGATVLDPVKGIHNNCIILDFQSLYPSIVIAFNICPSTYNRNFRKTRIGLFPNCIQNLLTERQRIRVILKDVTDPIQRIVLDKKQNALKICANSMYGIMGFASNKYFGCIQCAEKVTAIGREILLSTVKYIENKYNIQVIYGDTDSCILKLDKDMSQEECKRFANVIAEDISSILPDPLKLQFEEYYSKIILLSKKRYVMKAQDGSLKYKGIMIARRGYCNFAKNLYREIVNIILSSSDSSKVNEFINFTYLSLYDGKVPIKDLVMTKSIKDVNEYKTLVPQVIMARRLISMGHNITKGSRLEYVFCKTESTQQGYKMYTPQELKEYNLKIDYDYYIKKQIYNSIEELLLLMQDF